MEWENIPQHPKEFSHILPSFLEGEKKNQITFFNIIRRKMAASCIRDALCLLYICLLIWEAFAKVLKVIK